MVKWMPYPNEHAARINDPSKYDSFSRDNDAGGRGVDFIWGILPDGGVEIQAIRFDAQESTVDEAKQWLDEHDFQPIEFEPATGSSDRSETVLHSVQMKEAEMADREIRARLENAEIRADDGEIRVSGYAAVFGEETNIGGMFTEVIERGAFKNAIARQDDVVFLINHDGLPLARTRSGTMTLTEDERGLFMEAVLDGEDPDVRSIVPKMKRGDLDKMSFAFIPERQAWDDSGKMPKRMIQDVRLYDVSIVTTPAYDGTAIGLRSLEKHREAQKRSQAARRLRMKAKAAGIEARNEYLQPAFDPFAQINADDAARNMQNAIENWHLGPEAASEDPTANEDFWASIAQVWSVNVAEARRRLCANCAYFNNTPEMLRQMEDIPQTAFDADGGGRGWCEKLDFICHNLRVCQAWERKDFVAEEE